MDKASEHHSYHAARDDLPSDLPTLAEIQSSNDIICNQSGRQVVGVGIDFVIKYGKQVDLEEGRIMLYVSKYTSAAVPKVYAFFQDSEQHKNYIVMQRIAGQTLQEAWPSLTNAQKTSITTKLKAVFDELRRLPSPGAYCGLDNRPLPDDLFWNCHIDHNSAQEGPFESEESLNCAMLKRYTLQNPRGKANFYQKVSPQIFSSHSPIFTHGDFQPKNIMVWPITPASLASEIDNDMHVTIIDWEYAGWYPSYWEYARALFACGRFEDDWNMWINCILEPYLNEYAWMNMLMLELWS